MLEIRKTLGAYWATEITKATEAYWMQRIGLTKVPEVYWTQGIGITKAPEAYWTQAIPQVYSAHRLRRSSKTEILQMQSQNPR